MTRVAGALVLVVVAMLAMLAMTPSGRDVPTDWQPRADHCPVGQVLVVNSAGGAECRKLDK